jgi:hypothetical protein
MMEMKIYLKTQMYNNIDKQNNVQNTTKGIIKHLDTERENKRWRKK